MQITSNQLSLNISTDFVGLEPQYALTRILFNTKQRRDPVLIVINGMYPLQREFFEYVDHKEVYFVKTGVVCPIGRILDEFLRKLKPEEAANNRCARLHLFGIIRKIGSIVNQKKPPLFIIECCDRLDNPSLYYLLGMVNELKGKVQVFFVTTEANLTKFAKKSQSGIAFLFSVFELRHHISNHFENGIPFSR